MGSSGGHVMLSNAAHYTSVDHCFFGTTPLNALRHYGGTPGPADDPYNSLGTVFRNNLFSGNMYAAIEYKGTGDPSHGSSFFNSVYKAGTLYFTEQPQFNLSNNIYCYGCAVGPDEPIPPSNITGTINDASYTTYFADPAHLDFRLQNVPASPYIGSLTEKPAPGAVHDPLIGNLDVSSYDDKGPYQFYENLPGEDNWDGYGKHGRALFVSPSGTGNGYAKSTPTSITQALTLAAPGDTIYLIGGIYTAPISIDCSVQQSAPTCVKGLKKRPITISGYGNDTVQISGISINTSEYLVLQSLIIENNIENGIHIKESHDITIQNNRILNNTKTGILQENSNRISILSNTILGNQKGIDIVHPDKSQTQYWNSWITRILGNIVSENGGLELKLGILLNDIKEGFVASNQNDFFGGTLIHLAGGASFSDISAWQNSSRLDAESFSLRPEFSGTDLKLTIGNALRGQGYRKSHMGYGGAEERPASWTQAIANVSETPLTVTPTTATFRWDTPRNIRVGVLAWGITDQNGAINDTQITNFMLHQGYNFYSNRHMLTIKNLAPNTEYAVRVGTRKAGGYTDYKPWPPGSNTWDLSRTVLKDHTPNNFTELGQNQYKYFDLAWHEKTLIFKTPPEPEYPKPHVYFVSAATGDDFNHNGLSLQTPWKTINKATQTALPGDTIFVVPGTYSE